MLLLPSEIPSLTADTGAGYYARQAAERRNQVAALLPTIARHVATGRAEEALYAIMIVEGWQREAWCAAEWAEGFARHAELFARTPNALSDAAELAARAGQAACQAEGACEELDDLAAEAWAARHAAKRMLECRCSETAA